jgi:hypothetical protein
METHSLLTGSHLDGRLINRVAASVEPDSDKGKGSKPTEKGREKVEVWIACTSRDLNRWKHKKCNHNDT